MARWPAGWLLLLLLPACVATVTPPPPLFLKAAGSTSAAPLFNTLATTYQAENPHVTFDLEGGGSELGYQLVAGGQVDFGLVSWPPANISDQLQVIPVGRDAIALIVHPQNPVGDFSLENLRQIFNGRYFNWQTVGGPDLPIQVISREDGSGTRAAFEAQVMDGSPVTPTAIVLPNSQAVVDFVAQHPEAVAYVSLAFVTPAVRTVAVEGVAPSLESLNNNSYLLRRELALVVQQPLRPEVEQFTQFALSPAGQQLVGERWGRVR
jgi:phosphate transport system substrate-binding protein